MHFIKLSVLTCRIVIQFFKLVISFIDFGLKGFFLPLYFQKNTIQRKNNHDRTNGAYCY